MARQHGKTTLAVSYILWKALHNSNLDILVVSSALSQSTKFLERVKEGIIDNELLIQLKPSQDTLLGRNSGLMDYKWSAGEIWTVNRVKVFVRPFGSSIRGLSPHIVICDDILRNDEGNNSLTEDRTVELFNSDIMPTVNTTRGKVLVIGTPISFTDLLSRLNESTGFATATFPAVITNKKGEWVKPLWESRFTLEDWEMERKRVGSYSFSKEYMCKPLSSEDSFFREEILKKQLKSKYKAKRKEDAHYFLGVDVALSKSTKADYTVYTVLEMDDDGFLWLVYKERAQGKSIDDIISDLERLNAKWKFTHGLIEDNSISYGLVQKVIENRNLMCMAGFNTNKTSKERILTQLQAAFERGELFIPEDESLLEELAAFGIKKVRGKETLEGLGQHDDQVMSLAIALEAAVEGGGIISKAEWL